MKRMLLCLFLVFTVLSAFSAFTLVAEKTTAATLQVTIGKQGQKISLKAFTEMDISEYEILTGEQLSWFGKIHFRHEQRKLRRLLNSDVNSMDEEKVYKDLDQSNGFNLAGFMMGFSLSVIGVLAMYLTKDSRKANRTKWAWVGAAFWVAFLIVVISVA